MYRENFQDRARLRRRRQRRAKAEAEAAAAALELEAEAAKSMMIQSCSVTGGTWTGTKCNTLAPAVQATPRAFAPQAAPGTCMFPKERIALTGNCEYVKSGLGSGEFVCMYDAPTGLPTGSPVGVAQIVSDANPITKKSIYRNGTVVSEVPCVKLLKYWPVVTTSSDTTVDIGNSFNIPPNQGPTKFMDLSNPDGILFADSPDWHNDGIGLQVKYATGVSNDIGSSDFNIRNDGIRVGG